MLTKRNNLILEIAKMDHVLQCQKNQVRAQKNKIITSWNQQYSLFLMAALFFALLTGWKIGKDMNATQISTEMLKDGLLFVISQYQLIEH